jgi:MarC family membrane protein
MDGVTTFSAIILLFLIMDPIGNIPLFLSALKNVDEQRQKRIIIRELLIAWLVMIIFLFAGRHVLHLLNISEPSLTIAGGIILFLIALRMIFPEYEGKGEQLTDNEPFIVPLAIPWIAGPAALASVLFIANRHPDRWPWWFLAITIACFTSGFILFFASGLSRYLGRRGIIAIERLMGLILVTISVQMFMTGIAAFLSFYQAS